MLYDPTDGSFRPVGAPVGLLYGPTILLSDGNLLLLSDGNLLLGGNANQTEVYSPGSNSFTASDTIDLGPIWCGSA